MNKRHYRLSVVLFTGKGKYDDQKHNLFYKNFVLTAQAGDNKQELR